MNSETKPFRVVATLFFYQHMVNGKGPKAKICKSKEVLGEAYGKTYASRKEATEVARTLRCSKPEAKAITD